MIAPQHLRFVMVLLLLTAGTAWSQSPPTSANRDEQQANQWLANVESFRRLTNSRSAASGSARPNAPTVTELLRTAPDGESLARLPAELRKTLKIAVLDLHLRDDDVPGAVGALQSIEGGLGTDGSLLATAILRAWTRINGAVVEKMITATASRRLALPITRMTRARNTAELAQLAATLRDTLHMPPPAEALVDAFVSVQGRTIAFDAEDLKEVFRPADKIDIDTLLTLASTLRDNIAAAEHGVVGKTADDKSQAVREIADAYTRLEDMLLARMKTADAWQVRQHLAIARYRRSEFSRAFGFDVQSWPEQRAAAFAAFAEAADAFHNAGLERVDDENPYEDWFNAATGALNPGQPGVEPQPDPTELRRLGQRINSLPADDAERRSQRLADFVVEQSRKASPEFRQQYVRAGLAVINGQAAAPLRRLAVYYDDLLADLKLVCSLDGPPAIGVNQPFGVRVALLHSATLDHEVGGFSRLLRGSGPGGTAPAPGVSQQNNLTGFIDYRARMESRLRRVLGGKLEIINIVWADGQSPALPSTPAGWTQTPLAYLIVKATDISLDTFPPLELDLDFADRSDNDRVILPVVSEGLPLNAASTAARPYDVTSVTELLNDQLLPAGNVGLEIKVIGHGMLPPIDQLFDLKTTGWAVQKIVDSDTLADRYEVPTAAVANALPRVVSQRTCTITYAPTASHNSQSLFTFPSPAPYAGQTLKIERQQYADGNIIAANATVSLAGATGSMWRWLTWPVTAVLAIGTLLFLAFRRKTRIDEPSMSALSQPELITPFTAITFLRRLRARVSDDGPASIRHKLDKAISDIESSYYKLAEIPQPVLTADELQSLVARCAAEAYTMPRPH